jgi:hypothetical protein
MSAVPRVGPTVVLSVFQMVVPSDAPLDGRMAVPKVRWTVGSKVDSKADL